MIVYDLKCDAGHVFEAWFRDSAAYDKLHARHKVTCADCGSTKVERQLSAPAINTRGEAPPRDAPDHVRKAMTMLRELRGYRLLEGVRGAAPRDLAALRDALVRLSWLAHDQQASLAELDINPLVLYERGAGAKVVDALIVGRKGDGNTGA
jgi:hypothetical protein